ncbi:hypothetical protein [Streptomyces sp. YIM 98790]|uniref:hypothetical protein n=1 Tax=Streptomyces sp. YIM 98790 TaxID=2689077 RepID=UPI00140A6DA8|nr:hypothetical protein [Streptomyces sp. YIM 98790]
MTAVVLGAAAVASACGDGGEGAAARDAADAPRQTTSTATPTLNPDDFTTTIDNPYLPLEPGTRFTYENAAEDDTEEDTERVVVEVTDRTREVMGITTVVVRDTVTVDGETVRESRDWFAQDSTGNVWYFGEETRELENGEVTSTEGSWEAGEDGAHPGIVMPADPRVGAVYPQENAPGVAEDTAEVLSRDESVEVPYGSFDNVVQTKDYTPLEPDMVEHKYYAEGVGLVLEEEVEGGDDRLELVSVERP